VFALLCHLEPAWPEDGHIAEGRSHALAICCKMSLPTALSPESIRNAS
jgi:hypothetical protein